jgi:hypothetical protein
MNARQSVDKLIEVLMKHHDGWLTHNAAYAIGYLSDKAQSKRTEDYLLTLDNNWSYLFTFGKGLIEKGDFNGIKYLTLEFDPLIKGKRNKKVKILIKEILSYRPFMGILLFNYGEIEVRNYKFYDQEDGKFREFKSIKEVVDFKQNDVISIYNDILECIRYNNLHDFDEIVRDLARKSNNRDIRKISNSYLLDDFDY